MNMKNFHTSSGTRLAGSRLFCIVFLALQVSLSVWAQDMPFRNESLPIEQRVDDLLGRMTVTEKIDLLRATSPENKRLGFPKYFHGNEALHGVVRPGRFTALKQ